MSVTSPGATSFPSSAPNGNESFSFTHIEGFDYEFDPPLDVKYECPICLSTLREPRQTSCGHRFCRDCILRWLRESGKRCPIDNEGLSEQDIFPDNFAKREILNCSVKCPNHKDGCQAKMILSQMRAHLDECPFSLKPCPNHCASILPYKDMKDHMEKHCQYRLISCSLCQCTLKANNLEDHATECPKSAVHCQYCNAALKRDEMERHVLDLCEKVVISCPFQMFGCHTVNERGKERDHLLADVPSHMKQLSHTTAFLIQQLGNVASRLNQNGIKHSHGHSEFIDQVSGTLSHLNVSNQPAPSGVPQASNFPKFSESPVFHAPLERNWSNPVGLLQKHVGHQSAEGSPQSSLSDPKRRPSLPHSFPPIGSQRSSCDISNANNGLPQATSTPPFVSRNSGHSSPFESVSPESSVMNHTHAVSAIPESSSNHYVPNHINHISPSSPLNIDSTQHNVPQSLTQSEGEENIHSFVTTLQELCIQQNAGMAFQHQMIEHMYHQLCQLQRSNQELVKQVRDLESRSLHFDTRTHCGDFYWRVSDYSDLRKRAGNGETTILHSDPFLTGPWGYKLCIRANISGFVNSDHEHYLSLFIHFMQGCNDSLLRWPFKGQIILSVIDQNEVYSDRQHIVETLEAKPHLEAFKQPTSTRNHKGFGFTEFVTLSTLEGGTFIRNNTVVIRAQVFPEN